MNIKKSTYNRAPYLPRISQSSCCCGFFSLFKRRKWNQKLPKLRAKYVWDIGKNWEKTTVIHAFECIIRFFFLASLCIWLHYNFNWEREKSHWYCTILWLVCSRVQYESASAAAATVECARTNLCHFSFAKSLSSTDELPSICMLRNLVIIFAHFVCIELKHCYRFRARFHVFHSRTVWMNWVCYLSPYVYCLSLSFSHSFSIALRHIPARMCVFCISYSHLDIFITSYFGHYVVSAWL